ncbi:DNA-3-methyladenine glycosylase [Lacibacter sp.]|uniref:DNA-3-methyladenine glycosylase n=1 Tax=Lacibacter sp. TaxID=1915409 RepID=UPI002B4B7FA3|nr:DNA-3-methyladenine glycosylase [Lacibacter sp.]HLP36376.1 DNA-3-methyladenine glycosylase [Lacibacter sp.]
MQKLSTDFYERDDVVQIAKDLLGKYIITKFDQQTTVGRIVETEAYAGIIDKASHAYNNRRTARTEVMFGPAGVSYVYLCYGIHHLFNVVCNVKDKPDAVLIRGIEPVEGINVMLRRFNKEKADSSIGRGPGNVSKALGISTKHTGLQLQSRHIWLAEDVVSTSFNVLTSPRIGVDYAGDHALWLYRFFIGGHPQVSKHAFNKTAISLF